MLKHFRGHAYKKAAIAVLVFVFSFVTILAPVAQAHAAQINGTAQVQQAQQVLTVEQFRDPVKVTKVTKGAVKEAGQSLLNFGKGIFGKGTGKAAARGGKVGSALAIGTGVVLGGVASGVAEAAVSVWVGWYFMKVISEIFFKIVSELLVWSFNSFIALIQYNKFLDSVIVNTGWTVVRDIVNLFFVLILLVIAFATVFRVKNYQFQQLLPKFAIVVIVVNFSRTIIGFFLDFAQVIMMMFGTAISQTGAGNFVKLLRMNEWMELKPVVDAGISKGVEGISGAAGVAAWLAESAIPIQSYITAILTLIIGTAALSLGLTLLFIIVYRIVAIWLLIIISPIAFLLAILPSTQQYFSKWLDMLVKQILVGPLLVFFVWLALSTMQQSPGAFDLISSKEGIADFVEAQGGVDAIFKEGNLGNLFSAAGSKISVWNNLTALVVGLVILIAGIKFSASISGGAASADKVIGFGTGLGKKLGSKAGKAVTTTADYYGRSSVAGERMIKNIKDIPVAGQLMMSDKERGEAITKRLSEKKAAKFGSEDYATSATSSQFHLIKTEAKKIEEKEGLNRENIKEELIDIKAAGIPAIPSPKSSKKEVAEYTRFEALKREYKRQIDTDSTLDSKQKRDNQGNITGPLGKKELKEQFDAEYPSTSFSETGRGDRLDKDGNRVISKEDSQEEVNTLVERSAKTGEDSAGNNSFVVNISNAAKQSASSNDAAAQVKEAVKQSGKYLSEMPEIISQKVTPRILSKIAKNMAGIPAGKSRSDVPPGNRTLSDADVMERIMPLLENMKGKRDKKGRGDRLTEFEQQMLNDPVLLGSKYV